MKNSTLHKNLIMGNISFGGSSDDGGSASEHVGYGVDAAANDPDDGWGGWAVGPDDVQETCGSCHPSVNGEQSNAKLQSQISFYVYVSR